MNNDAEAIEALARELREIERRFSSGELRGDRDDYRQAARRHKHLSKILSLSAELNEVRGEREAAEELLAEVGSDAGADTELREMMEDADRRAAELSEEIAFLLLPVDGNEDKNVIVEIRGAEGGEEANLFARDLFEMYQGFAERKGWKVEMLGSQHSGLGGITEVTFQISGDGVWEALRFEGGPHRVQRVPVTESQGRIHTSSATVAVLPEADEVEIEIDEADLQIDVFRSSGPGGQSVNTTDSAVRVTHLPTGLVVSMQDEKSQLQNRNKALRVLRARLLRAEQERQSAEESDRRRSQIGRGGRSEKIRTYNFRENRVTDHRIGLTLYKLDRILSGGLDEIVEALGADNRVRALEQSLGAAREQAVSWDSLRAEAEGRLRAAGVPGAADDVRRMVAAAAGCEYGRVFTMWSRPAGALGASALEKMLVRRESGEPLQYALGNWGFRTLDLAVDERVFIPRPETEVVAGIALGELRRHEGPAAPMAADLGCGSGAIGFSLAAEHTGVEVYCTDVSADALSVARSNLAGLGMPGRRVRLAEGPWYEALPGKLRGRLALVVSNPPYVAEDEPLPESVDEHEPAVALRSGPTGLEDIEVILSGASDWLEPGGLVVLEIPERRASDVRGLAMSAGLAEVAVHPDLAGRSRVLCARNPA